ncbi:hypothetical protein CEXT_288121 [Caerostris extrusa]|uniref:Uncharacterized protein n=1 Tax=Caerostris extrusa TaxID=172846 RepID=A0AAV4P5I4_CAEEX|nr:hypothetical protein CEXT_288121 [Caerostris extrusa]
MSSSSVFIFCHPPPHLPHPHTNSPALMDDEAFTGWGSISSPLDVSANKKVKERGKVDGFIINARRRVAFIGHFMYHNANGRRKAG